MDSRAGRNPAAPTRLDVRTRSRRLSPSGRPGRPFTTTTGPRAGLSVATRSAEGLPADLRSTIPAAEGHHPCVVPDQHDGRGASPAGAGRPTGTTLRVGRRSRRRRQWAGCERPRAGRLPPHNPTMTSVPRRLPESARERGTMGRDTDGRQWMDSRAGRNPQHPPDRRTDAFASAIPDRAPGAPLHHDNRPRAGPSVTTVGRRSARRISGSTIPAAEGHHHAES